MKVRRIQGCCKRTYQYYGMIRASRSRANSLKKLSSVA